MIRKSQRKLQSCVSGLVEIMETAEDCLCEQGKFFSSKFIPPIDLQTPEFIVRIC